VKSAVALGAAAVLAIIAIPLLANLGGDSPRQTDRRVTDDNALLAVRAAVGNTIASGSYDTEFDTHTTHPNTMAPTCPAGATTCRMAGSDSTFDSSGHGTVNLDPFISRVVTSSNSSYGPRTLYVTSTSVWLNAGTAGGAEYGTPLSSFASAVEGALGPSNGALAMIGLASPGGALNLEQAAIADATPAGTGTVGEVNVTYYDVTIDMAKLADNPYLSDVQRVTIHDALPVLERGGYTGTTERIGVDDVGYIREITASNHFTDGSTGVRHTVLSNFGCAAKLVVPGEIVPPEMTVGECTSPIPTTSSVAPATVPSTTTSSLPIPSTSVVPPPTTAPSPSTTLAPPPPPSSTTTTTP
jgi:hypothetical protein